MQRVPMNAWCDHAGAMSYQRYTCGCSRCGALWTRLADGPWVLGDGGMQREPEAQQGGRGR
jgi:hypothetical protein